MIIFTIIIKIKNINRRTKLNVGIDYKTIQKNIHTNVTYQASSKNNVYEHV